MSRLQSFEEGAMKMIKKLLFTVLIALAVFGTTVSAEEDGIPETEDEIVPDDGEEIPENPETIGAPIISELVCEHVGENENGDTVSDWKLYAEYPASVIAAETYYRLKEQCDDALITVLEYRVYRENAWDDWQSVDPLEVTGQSGQKYFRLNQLSDKDIFEIHLYIRNRLEESRSSGYSNTLACNEVPEDVVKPTPTPADPEAGMPYTAIRFEAEFKPGGKVSDTKVRIFSTRDPERRNLTDRTNEFRVITGNATKLKNGMTIRFLHTVFQREDGVEYDYENESRGIYAVRMRDDEVFEEGETYGVFIGSLSAKDGSDLDIWSSNLILFNGVDCELAGGGYGNTGSDLMLYSYINRCGGDEPTNNPTPTTKPEDSETVLPNRDNANPKKEKNGCKLCGICPVQPLGVCLFVWLAILLAAAAAVVIFRKKTKRKRKKRASKRK